MHTLCLRVFDNFNAQLLRRVLPQSWESISLAQQKEIQTLITEGLVNDSASPHHNLRRQIALLVGIVASLSSTVFDLEAIVQKVPRLMCCIRPRNATKVHNQCLPHNRGRLW